MLLTGGQILGDHAGGKGQADARANTRADGSTKGEVKAEGSGWVLWLRLDVHKI